MRNSLKRALVGVAAVGVVVAAGAAYAHGEGRGRFMKHMVQNRIEDAEDLIEATPQQRLVIDGVKNEVFAKLEKHAAMNEATHGQLLSLLTADTLDARKLQSIADEKAAEISALAKELIPEVQKIHDVLTPAQRQKLAAHAQKMQARHHQMMDGEQ